MRCRPRTICCQPSAVSCHLSIFCPPFDHLLTSFFYPINLLRSFMGTPEFGWSPAKEKRPCGRFFQKRRLGNGGGGNRTRVRDGQRSRTTWLVTDLNFVPSLPCNRPLGNQPSSNPPSADGILKSFTRPEYPPEPGRTGQTWNRRGR